ncbi:VWA domain-containing protein, partial [candidate division KSB1 bacterium]|nr:VWA domain-containing protein [candidate division KSB1 bacterium]
MKIKFLIIGLLFPLLGFADGVLKVMNLPYTYLPLKSVEVTSKIEYQVAETITKQTFMNNTGINAKLKFGFPLDRRASVTRVRWLKEGIWYQGKIFERPQDTTAVNPGGLPDRQFLDYMGDNPFYITFRDSLAHNQQILIELTYIELLEYDSRQIYYRYPLDLKHLINNKLDNFRISITLKSELPILNPSCLSFQTCQIITIGNLTHVTYENSQIFPDRDFILKYGTEYEFLNMISFSHFPEPDSGYFLMLFEPPVAENPASHDPIAALFVLDISGSMAGIKLDQAQSIINKALMSLLPEDYINIIVFNEEIKSFQITPVPNSLANSLAAQNFLNGLAGTGKTELNSALNYALQQKIPNLIRPVIILITDGQIEGQFGQVNNTQNIPIFIWGVGQTIDRLLLTKIAQENGGFVEFPRKDNLDRCIESFFSKICHPFLTDIKFEFSGTTLEEIYPTRFLNLYAG